MGSMFQFVLTKCEKCFFFDTMPKSSFFVVNPKSVLFFNKMPKVFKNFDNMCKKSSIITFLKMSAKTVS